LSADGAKDHLGGVVPENLEIYKSPSDSATTAYKLGGTPETLVVSTDGKIMKRWRGAWTGDSKAEIEGFFHCSLPGLLPEQEAHK
jgi:hypothetical protein